MKELETLKADFRDWLTLPLTKTFVKIISAQKQNHIDFANQASYQSYYKKETSEQSTLAYGKADGIDTILSLMETCKEEEPQTTTINGEEVKTYPTIDALFEQAFGGENE